MYRLIMNLPLDVTIVHTARLATVEDARALVESLPPGFEIVSENNMDLSQAVEVPFRKRPDEK